MQWNSGQQSGVQVRWLDNHKTVLKVLVAYGVGLLLVGAYFLHRRQLLAEFNTSEGCGATAVIAPARESCRRVALRIDRRSSSKPLRATIYRFDISDPSGVIFPSLVVERAAYEARREGDTVEGLLWRGKIVSISWPGATHLTTHHPAGIPFFIWNTFITLSLCFLIVLYLALTRRPPR
jgi:hypothetical protein